MQQARDKESMGVEFALLSAEVIPVCNRYNISWGHGNPRTSRLRKVPFLAQLLQSSAVHCVDLDFRRYGEL